MRAPAPRPIGLSSAFLGAVFLCLTLHPPPAFSRTLHVSRTGDEIRARGGVDQSVPVILYPKPIWATFLGGRSNEKGNGVALDGIGNVYVVGETGSSGWTSGGYDTIDHGIGAGFVAKYTPSGAHIWSTYVGERTQAYGIAVDGSDNVYVTGKTEASGWVSDGSDTNYNGAGDAFVVKLSPSGDHLWSTYLGGIRHDFGSGIAIDASGNIHVTGYTESLDWVSGGFDTSHNGRVDSFVVKLSPNGAHQWSTFLGGSEFDEGRGITVDDLGNVCVTGYTESPNWVSGGFVTIYHGNGDTFVAKLSPSGDHLWSTFLGGSNYDRGFGIAVDNPGNVFVTGETYSSEWVAGGLDTTHGGERDAFVAKLSSSGVYLWSTFLGGSNDEQGFGIAVDSPGNVFVTGVTDSSGWISGGFDTTLDGFDDAFLVKLSPNGVRLWSSYIGGNNPDEGNGIAVNGWGDVYLTGRTVSGGWTSIDFDIIPSNQGGSSDAFLARIRDNFWLNCDEETRIAKKLILACSGGVANEGIAENLRVRFHSGIPATSSCGLVPSPTETLLFECEIDREHFVGLNDCEEILRVLGATIGACIDDHVTGTMTWAETPGIGLVIQSRIDFHCLLVGSEVGASEESGLGYPLDFCPIYNLYDGITGNETSEFAVFTSGLGFACEAVACKPTPTLTPTPTVTTTPTATRTPTITPTPRPVTEIFFVSKSGSGEGGTTWETAFNTVGEALFVGLPGDEIWIARGTYNENIRLVSDVSVYGGFSGMETEDQFYLRDWKNNRTVLDGEGLQASVVTANNAVNCTLDGVVVTNGSGLGAGIALMESALTLMNAVVSGNRTRSKGAGIYLSNSSLQAADCVIDHNDAFGTYSFFCTLTQCFGGLSPANGGGIYSTGSFLGLTRSTVNHNRGDYGAALFFEDSVGVFQNSVVSGNHAIRGAGLYGVSSELIVNNCTFGSNSTRDAETSIYCGPFGNCNSTTTQGWGSSLFLEGSLGGEVASSIFHGTGGAEIFGDLAISYSNIRGGWTGPSNIDADPRFLDIGGGDFRLAADSPCIDSGTDVGLLIDLEGNPRPVDVPGVGRDGTGDEFDMGAYEFPIGGFPTWTPTFTPTLTPTLTPTMMFDEVTDGHIDARDLLDLFETGRARGESVGIPTLFHFSMYWRDRDQR